MMSRVEVQELVIEAAESSTYEQMRSNRPQLELVAGFIARRLVPSLDRRRVMEALQ